ncbi:MAG TPA: 50S ribosome-binding GTPase [Phycisphaerae bacterium]|nr:50S ribosome-binding GTPase [Phycisphaerae bacterium]HRY66437.1 50S ribosome-binding GTPase [Phycisphaerae bacterium]HSA25855.1 50S ribosome-binding GTPase [Phycisphaerae bacterium]
MDLTEALEVLAREGSRLRDPWALPWEDRDQQAVHALRFRSNLDAEGQSLLMVAVLGGASSGKSTVFNNLLDGHRASCVTVKAHSTRGVIMAVHQDHRDRIGRWFGEPQLMFPSLKLHEVGIEEAVLGDPAVVTVVYHAIERLKPVLLLDTPDLTSAHSEREGDLAKSLLPWFDKVLLVVNFPQRWRDRQVAEFAGDAVLFCPDRFVLFNHTQEGELGDPERRALDEQAGRLRARFAIVDYSAGRGLRRLVLPDAIWSLLAKAPEHRLGLLRRQVHRAAEDVYSENELRRQLLAELKGRLQACGEKHLPSEKDCIRAMMTQEEQQAVLWFRNRLLGVKRFREKMESGAARVAGVLSKIPVVGRLFEASADAPFLARDPRETREQIAWKYFESSCGSLLAEFNKVSRSSKFWKHLGRAADPCPSPGGAIQDYRERMVQVIQRLDGALTNWAKAVQSQWEGVGAAVAGAASAGTAAALVLLYLHAGPIGWLLIGKIVVAHWAILAGTIVTGAAGGKPLRQTIVALQEKLGLSREYRQVQEAAVAYRGLMEEFAWQVSRQLHQTAEAWVLDPQTPLAEALDVLSQGEEGEP